MVHASCSIQDRSSLYEGLLLDKDDGGHPWMMIGDFNLILDQREKCRGRPFKLAQSMEFLNFLNEDELTDVEFLVRRLFGVIIGETWQEFGRG